MVDLGPNMVKENFTLTKTYQMSTVFFPQVYLLRVLSPSDFVISSSESGIWNDMVRKWYSDANAQYTKLFTQNQKNLNLVTLNNSLTVVIAVDNAYKTNQVECWENK